MERFGRPVLHAVTHWLLEWVVLSTCLQHRRYVEYARPPRSQRSFLEEGVPNLFQDKLSSYHVSELDRTGGIRLDLGLISMKDEKLIPEQSPFKRGNGIKQFEQYKGLLFVNIMIDPHIYHGYPGTFERCSTTSQRTSLETMAEIPPRTHRCP